jgi:hypothetical protein
VEPLLRVIVCAVEKMGEGRACVTLHHISSKRIVFGDILSKYRTKSIRTSLDLPERYG